MEVAMKMFPLRAFLVMLLLSAVAFGQRAGPPRTDGPSIPEVALNSPAPPLPAGVYTVGTLGHFPTIDSAFTRIRTGIAGSITLELVDAVYNAPTNETGFLMNGPIPGAGPDRRLTIKPAESKNVTIQGSGMDVLLFLNTSYVTMDGVALPGAGGESGYGRTSLTIHAYYNAQFPYNACLDFMNNSDHNIVRNIVFISEDYNRSGNGPCFWTALGYTSTPDSNLIENNLVRKAGIPIYVSGYYSNVRALGNIVRGNRIGTEQDSLVSWGIQMESCKNAVVENNIVQNLKGLADISVITHGINSYGGEACIIRNNIVHGIHSDHLWGSTGILLSGDATDQGLGEMVYNNAVYDIQSTSWRNESRVTGIQLLWQDDPKIYHNSVYLSGTGNNRSGSAALYISPICTNVDSKNNILVNVRDESPWCASAVYNYSNTNLITDYNDLYYQTGQYSCLVRAFGSDYHTLVEWQATLQDLNSYDEMPGFIDPNLHVSETTATYLESNATPIGWITVDMDGEARNPVNPDIGADEFDGILPGVEETAGLPDRYVLRQNYPNPFNPSTTIGYALPRSAWVRLEICNILGEVVRVLKDGVEPAGYRNVTLDGNGLPSGVYIYRLQSGDFVAAKKLLLLR
jgi:hypothetical protein